MSKVHKPGTILKLNDKEQTARNHYGFDLVGEDFILIIDACEDFAYRVILANGRVKLWNEYYINKYYETIDCD